MTYGASVIEDGLAAHSRSADPSSTYVPLRAVDTVWKSALRTAPTAHYFACSSALLRCALRGPVSASTACDFARIDPSRLSAQGLLRRVKLADRVAAWASAQAARALADYVGPDLHDEDADRHHRLEVRIARKCSDNAAAGDIATARRLAAEARTVRNAWERGDVSSRHVFISMERTALAEPQLARDVFEQLEQRLPELTTSQLGTAITRTMCRLDARGEAQRTRIARRHNVGVAFRPLPDGLGQVIATHRIEDARALIDVIDSRADRILEHRRGCEPCAQALPDEIGPARAAAHLTLTIGAPGSASIPPLPTTSLTSTLTSTHSSGAGIVRSSELGSSELGALEMGVAAPKRRSAGELQVVIDLNTLLGLAENPGLAAGHPVPAEIARELANECGSMRRIITDPVTGHLLDYGNRRYLPAPLKNFIAARDGTCRSPGCGQPATRSQLDHIEPYPTGPSNTSNTHSLCKRDHDSKTAGDFRVVSHDASGRMTWRTRDGQHGELAARPYLNDPAQDAPTTGSGDPPQGHGPALPAGPYPF